jgi:hypothetical protein
MLDNIDMGLDLSFRESQALSDINTRVSAATLHQMQATVLPSFASCYSVVYALAMKKCAKQIDELQA